MKTIVVIRSQALIDFLDRIGLIPEVAEFHDHVRTDTDYKGCALMCTSTLPVHLLALFDKALVVRMRRPNGIYEQDMTPDEVAENYLGITSYVVRKSSEVEGAQTSAPAQRKREHAVVDYILANYKSKRGVDIAEEMGVPATAVSAIAVAFGQRKVVRAKKIDTNMQAEGSKELAKLIQPFLAVHSDVWIANKLGIESRVVRQVREAEEVQL